MTTTMGPLLPPFVAPLHHRLILDMEHTLLVSQMTHEYEGSKYFEVMKTSYDGRGTTKYVYKGLVLDLFLTYMVGLIKIVVFTPSIKGRAGYFMDEIDRDKLVSFRLYKELYAKLGSTTSGLKTYLTLEV
jgi:TFIIF-interacting CTD phosphatase-like protein